MLAHELLRTGGRLAVHEALYKSGSITEASWEQRQTNARIAQQQVRAAAAELSARAAAHALARTNFAHATIEAPIDGIVITRSVDPGQTVASMLQTPVLFTVAADLRRMRVIAAVDEADIGEVERGQPATFSVHAHANRTFPAIVTEVRNSPEVIHEVVTYGVALSVNNDDLALKPGMTASVRIQTKQAHDTLRLPATALSFTPPGEQAPSGPSVWQLDGEQLRRIEVHPSVSDDELTAIDSGSLGEGAPVLVGLTPEGRSAYALPH